MPFAFGLKDIGMRIKEFGFGPLSPERMVEGLRVLNAYDIKVCCAGGVCMLPGVRDG